MPLRALWQLTYSSVCRCRLWAAMWRRLECRGHIKCLAHSKCSLNICWVNTEYICIKTEIGQRRWSINIAPVIPPHKWWSFQSDLTALHYLSVLWPLWDEILPGLLVYCLELLQTVLITFGKLTFLILTGLVTLLLCIQRYSSRWHSRPLRCTPHLVFLLWAKLI